MTTTKLYSIKDFATGAFGVIFTSVDDITAQRDIAYHLITTPDSTLSRFPDQYTLYKVAEFNDVNGEVVAALEFVQSVSVIAHNYKSYTDKIVGEIVGASPATSNTVEGDAPAIGDDVVQFS